jgi:hypothetical protein
MCGVYTDFPVRVIQAAKYRINHQRAYISASKNGPSHVGVGKYFIGPGFGFRVA